MTTRRYGYALLTGLAALVALVPAAVAAVPVAIRISPGDNLIVTRLLRRPRKQTLVGQRWQAGAPSS